MAKITVYSDLPNGVQVLNKKTNKNILFKGMNSHKILLPTPVPFPNIVEDSDWEYFKETYKDYPAYFNKFDGDKLYVEKSAKEAKARFDNSKQVIADENLLSKAQNIKLYNKKD